MSSLWSRAVATGGNRWQMGGRRERLRQGKTTLARDSREPAVSLLDALAIERSVDAGWTPPATHAKPLTNRLSKPRRARSRKAVDARWTPRLESVASSANRRS